MRHLNYAPWSATTPPTFNLCQRQRKLYKNDNNNWKHGRYTFRFGANNRSAAAKEKRLVVQSGNGDNAFDMGNNTPPPFAPSPLPDFPFSECFIIMTIMFEHIKSLGKYLFDVYIIPFVFWLLRGFCGVIGKVEDCVTWLARPPFSRPFSYPLALWKVHLPRLIICRLHVSKVRPTQHSDFPACAKKIEESTLYTARKSEKIVLNASTEGSRKFWKCYRAYGSISLEFQHLSL